MLLLVSTHAVAHLVVHPRLTGHGPAVLADLSSGKAPEGSVGIKHDVVRWLRYFPSTMHLTDATELLASALRCPIASEVFRAAQRYATALPAPFRQLPTLSAMDWNSWPALESTMRVSRG